MKNCNAKIFYNKPYNVHVERHLSRGCLHLMNCVISHCLRQAGYVIVVVCLSVCLLATLRKKLLNGFVILHEIF